MFRYHNEGQPQLTPQLLHSLVGHVLTLAVAIAVVTPRYVPAVDDQKKRDTPAKIVICTSEGTETFDDGLRRARGIGPVGLQLVQDQCT